MVLLSIVTLGRSIRGVADRCFVCTMAALPRAAPHALARMRVVSVSSLSSIVPGQTTSFARARNASGLPWFDRGFGSCADVRLPRSTSSVGYRLRFKALRRGFRASVVVCEAEPLPVPEMGESITEGTVVAYMKEPGDKLEEDDIVAQIETDKITVDVRSPKAGVLTEILSEDGDVVQVGQAIATIDFSADAIRSAANGSSSQDAPSQEISSGSEPATEASASPPPVVDSSVPAKSAAPAKSATPVEPTLNMSESGERRVAMTRMRKRIAERLKEAQNTAAMLTTFNEIDMSSLMDLRNEFKDDFQKQHGAKLGFMSAYVKAAAVALQEQPEVNAFIDGGDIVYRDYVDISVAVSTPKGLVVPAIRGCENMNFATVEKTIVALGDRARKGELTIDEMQGGTFTISNGGVFGSLLSTPIINMPQSAILGMHIIQKRPVVVNDEIVIRPMMYVALSYDHRLIDGREAVTFLRRIKTLVEDPRRLLII